MISQTAEYALRAVICMAGRDKPLATRQLAEMTQAPAGYLAKVLQSLARSGIVASRRGLGGGFQLARAANDISLLDVVNAVDPLKRSRRCSGVPRERDSELRALCLRLDGAVLKAEQALAESRVGEVVASARGKAEDEASPAEPEAERSG